MGSDRLCHMSVFLYKVSNIRPSGQVKELVKPINKKNPMQKHTLILCSPFALLLSFPKAM